MLLLLCGVLMFIAYALSDLTGVVSEDVSLHKQTLEADKAVADKTKKLMDYDPSKARLVAP